MKLRKRYITAIIGAASLALVGLIALQIHLLHNALQLKRQAFAQNVHAALDAVVQQLETREIAAKVIDFTFNDSSFVKRSTMSVKMDVRRDSLGPEDQRVIRTNADSAVPRINLDSTKLVLQLPRDQYVRVMVVDSLGRDVSILDGFKSAGKHEVDLLNTQHPGAAYHFAFIADSSRYFTKISDGKLNLLPADWDKRKRRFLVEKVLDELSLEKQSPIQERINLTTLDSLMHASLLDRKITTPFAYGIVSRHNDSLSLSQPQAFSSDLTTTDFKARLFPNDLFAAPSDLVVYFPDQDFYLLKQIGVQVGLSLVFILIVAGAFVISMRIILTQKAFAERLSNFINNMTHEFKTPISTISLAAESIKNPEVRKDSQKLQRYANIIQDENTRMQNQVEKILQMAAIEEGDYELNVTAVNMHQLLERAIKNVGLQIEKRKGRIRSNLQATSPVVQADALHLSNVIHNLLDNALKYTRDEPHIEVTTDNVNGCLHIRIRDNGIGLSPEEQRRVFDKYYRVPTGNVHNVKGFGLGLSYVKLLVEAHNGTITLTSEPNEGTAFDITLPAKGAST